MSSGPTVVPDRVPAPPDLGRDDSEGLKLTVRRLQETENPTATRTQKKQCSLIGGKILPSITQFGDSRGDQPNWVACLLGGSVVKAAQRVGDFLVRTPRLKPKTVSQQNPSRVRNTSTTYTPAMN